MALEVELLAPQAADDAALVHELTARINAAYGAAEDELWIPGKDRIAPARVEEIVREGNMAVARLDGKVLGSVRLRAVEDAVGYFGLLAVDPAAQGRGAGGALIRFAEERSRARGAEWMELRLLVPHEGADPGKHRLHDWYSGLGYEDVDRADFGSSHPEEVESIAGSPGCPDDAQAALTAPYPSAMSSLPGGTVTFLFSDIEGSTKLLQALGDDYATVVDDHRRIMRECMTGHGGTEIDTQGDAFFFSFPRAKDAAEAAVEAQRGLSAHEWPQRSEVRVRMGLHTGEPQVGEHGYLGIDVVRAARICSAGQGGHILISETTRALLGNALPEGASVHDLGEQELKDIQQERIFELALDERAEEERPLKTEPHESKADSIAQSFEERISSYVEQQLEDALKSAFEGRKRRRER